MDSRNKIVLPEALPALGLTAPTVAVGYFDVLGPAHVAELDALTGAGPLLDVLRPSRVARLETADLRRRHELIEDVRRRHHA